MRTNQPPHVCHLNILLYASVACALAAWLPFSPYHLVWLLSSASWMNGWGWALRYLPFPVIWALALIVASTGVFFL